MTYELWESKGANLIADFPSQEKALDALRREIAQNTKADMTSWLLMYEDDQGDVHTVAAGAALIEMASAART